MSSTFVPHVKAKPLSDFKYMNSSDMSNLKSMGVTHIDNSSVGSQITVYFDNPAIPPFVFEQRENSYHGDNDRIMRIKEHYDRYRKYYKNGASYPTDVPVPTRVEHDAMCGFRYGDECDCEPYHIGENGIPYKKAKEPSAFEYDESLLLLLT